MLPKLLTATVFCIVMLQLFGCSTASFPEQNTDTETAATDQSGQTSFAETADTDETEELIVLRSDPDSDAPFLFEVTLEKTEFACDEGFDFYTAITNNGDSFYTFYYGYYAGCRFISEQEDQTVVIEMETDIPAAVRYDTIASGQRAEQWLFSPLYATVTDAAGTSWQTEPGYLPEGSYYVEVYYENCYVPEGGTYPDMVCDAYASEIFKDVEIIITQGD